MKLAQYRTLWGTIDVADGDLARSPHRTFEQVIPELARLGYDGIEIPFKLALYIGADKVRAALAQHNLKCNIMVFTDGPVVPGDTASGINLWVRDPSQPLTFMTADGQACRYTEPLPSCELAAALSAQGTEAQRDACVDRHFAVWQEQVAQAQAAFSPTLVVSHSGKDSFTFEMAERFFTKALAWEAETGFLVCHETHRKRFLHSPWVARDFFRRFPAIRSGIKMCADLSHWINVAETNCDDAVLTSVIEDLADRFYHVHCRVGYDHGPQVADPRAPEWLPYMEGHERWWDAIWAAQARRGDTVTTMIAEHGPPNYQQTLPYSREPVACIWDVNHWIHLRRQARFAQLYGKENSSRVTESASQGYAPATLAAEHEKHAAGSNGCAAPETGA